MTSLAPTMTTIDSLDAAAMSTVFHCMQPSDLAASASVSRDWAWLASDDRLWAAAYAALDSKVWRANSAHQLPTLYTGGGAVCPFARSYDRPLPA